MERTFVGEVAGVEMVTLVPASADCVAGGALGSPSAGAASAAADVKATTSSAAKSADEDQDSSAADKPGDTLDDLAPSGPPRHIRR